MLTTLWSPRLVHNFILGVSSADVAALVRSSNIRVSLKLLECFVSRNQYRLRRALADILSFLKVNFDTAAVVAQWQRTRSVIMRSWV